ncbi:MAG: multidrug transporter [Phycisphaeraceae bacterium]|nr:MAG: multidrug transporter [Phycisphaeraceae bacterium]
MAWLYLALAALFEILFAVSMKQSHGFTRLWPTVLTVIGVIGGISLLTLALKTLPVSVGYPIWVGVGTLGTVLFGVFMLDEPMSPVRVASIGAILLGVIGLKIASPGAGDESPPEISEAAPTPG